MAKPSGPDWELAASVWGAASVSDAAGMIADAQAEERAAIGEIIYWGRADARVARALEQFAEVLAEALAWWRVARAEWGQTHQE